MGLGFSILIVIAMRSENDLLLLLNLTAVICYLTAAIRVR